MKFTVPPGYVRTKPPAKPKLDPFIAVIDRVLFDDKSRLAGNNSDGEADLRASQGRVRLHGRPHDCGRLKGRAACRQRTQEMFAPLAHPPTCPGRLWRSHRFTGGVERKIHFFAFDLPHSTPASWSATLPRRRKPSATVTFGRSAFRRRFRSPSFMTTPRSPWLAFPWRRETAADARFRRVAITLPIPGSFWPAWQGQRQRAKLEGCRARDGTSLLLFPVFESFEALNAYLVVTLPSSDGGSLARP